MDDEAAEIELLEQNLNKTRQISQRMTSILTSFDTRLVKLEKSILPLYNSTQVLTRRAGNIEKALQKINELASNQEGIAAEEALILRGPQPGQLNTYTSALERLNASIAFKAQGRDSQDTANLVETGARKLTQLYTTLVAEGSSGPSSDFPPPPFPAPLLAQLQPLVTFLRTLPIPATYPSHPAARSIYSTLRDSQRGAADMRGSWLKKGLERSGERMLEKLEGVDGVKGGRDVSRWVEGLIETTEMEYGLLQKLTTLSDPALLSSAYNALLTPLMSVFTSTLSSLNNLVKKNLEAYTFLALSSYSSLSTFTARWDKMAVRRGNASGSELKDALQTLRATCLRSFPERLADIKTSAFGRGPPGELGTNLSDTTTSTVQYLERLPDVREGVGSALLTLGDGNWKMGEGVQLSRGPKLGEGDEGLVLEHFVYDVVNTLISSLTTLSRTAKRPALGAMFLLNNLAYLRFRLLLEPRNASLPELLSRPTQDALQSGFRTAKAGYFDASFMPMMQTLSDDPKGNKAAVKEKFTRFFDLLEEVAERHRMGKMLEEDEDGRDTLAEEVVKLIVPSLQRFTQKNREKEFSKNPQKYIKMTPDEVENMIRGLYS